MPLPYPTAHATLFLAMPDPHQPATESRNSNKLWCPDCARAVDDPLVCGDCSAVICRVCGTPLESPDELAFG